MLINTTRFGQIEVNEERVIFMPKGIIGFPGAKRFIILDHDGQTPFKWYQSLDEPSLAFVLIDPLIIRPDYSVDLSDDILFEIEIKDRSKVVVAVIVTVRENPEDITANLQGPIVFNLDNRRAKQVVLVNSEYCTRHYVLAEIRACQQKLALCNQ